MKEFFILLLLLETAMIGVFIALDLFLFYFFWEATLIPMALLIGMFGHGRRVYASVKFFLYTMIASVFMLAAILWLYANRAPSTTPRCSRRSPTAHWSCQSHDRLAGSSSDSSWPLPSRCRSSRCTPGCRMLTLRRPQRAACCWPASCSRWAPTACCASTSDSSPSVALNAPWIITLALIGIIYGALVALVQPNMKKLVAYSSVSHLGFVVLGIYSFTRAGMDGAVFQMLNHGISTGALFLLLASSTTAATPTRLKSTADWPRPCRSYATLFLVITLSPSACR